MDYTMPSYYNKFKCISSDCPDTCCAGWAIVIDNKTKKMYKSLSGSSGEYIRSHIDFDEGVYKRCGDRCSFLNNNNLCNLIINEGEDKLCKTCKRYPRHFEDYGALIEAALSISCPVAARLVIDNPDKDYFKHRTDDKKRHHNTDTRFLDCLIKVRNTIFSISGDRSKTIDERMAMILSLGEKIQPLVFKYEGLGAKQKFGIYSKNIFNEIYLILDNYKQICTYSLSKRKKAQRTADSPVYYANPHQLLKDYMDMFLGLENINQVWPKTMEHVIELLYKNNSTEEYMTYRKEFTNNLSSREYEYEHILNYFIFTYFLGGIYDYNIQGMIKLAIVSTLIIREMGMASWLESGRILTVEQQIYNAYSYSRQVEHSEDNLMAFEGILTAHPKFSEEYILSILCI